MNRTDFHIHSLYSQDGQYTPAELAKLCHEAGLTKVALTDHNSVAGVEEMISACGEYGIEVVRGAEYDCHLNGRNLHLLGYDMDIHAPCLQKLADYALQCHQNAGDIMAAAIQKLGIYFDLDKVKAMSRMGLVVGENIGEAALADPRNDGNPLLAPYRPSGARSNAPLVNFYWDFCAQGCPGYANIPWPAFEDVQKAIEESGGWSCLAHPAVTVGRDEAAIRYMQQCGVRGIETFCSYHDIADSAWFHYLAQELDMAETNGSDFHGKIKPNVVLGRCYKV